MKRSSSRKNSASDIYDAYVNQYKKNLKRIARIDSQATADKLRDYMPSKVEFLSGLHSYREVWAEQHPGRHRESAERIAIWQANRDTQERSYKQAKNIKAVAKKFGYELSLDQIRFGDRNREGDLKDFWDAYEAELYSVDVDSGELIHDALWYRELWNSPD